MLAVPGSAVLVRRFQGTTVLVDEVPAGVLEVVEVVRAGDRPNNIWAKVTFRV